MKFKIHYFNITAIVLLIFYLNSSNALPGQIFNFTYFACHANPDYFSNVNCGTKLTEKNFGAIFINTDIIKPVENVMVHAKSYKKKSDDQYDDGLYDMKLDGCAFLNGKSSSAIINAFLIYVRNTLKIPYRCPLQGHVDFNNFSIKSEKVPVLSVPGYYKFIIRGYYDEPKIDYGYIEAHVSVSSKSIKRQ